MTEDEKSFQKTITEIIEEVADDICSNYCKYLETAEEDGDCEPIRDGRGCPLHRLF